MAKVKFEIFIRARLGELRTGEILCEKTIEMDFAERPRVDEIIAFDAGNGGCIFEYAEVTRVENLLMSDGTWKVDVSLEVMTYRFDSVPHAVEFCRDIKNHGWEAKLSMR